MQDTKNFFISPFLINYEFFDKLCVEAVGILGLDLKDEKTKNDFSISMFLNFSRFITREMEELPTLKKNDLYKKLIVLMEKGEEGGTIELLKKNAIMPKALDEFLQIVRDTK